MAVWVSVYEETAGLTVNDPVLRTRKVLDFNRFVLDFVCDPKFIFLF